MSVMQKFTVNNLPMLREFYETQGYVVVGRLFSHECIQELKKEIHTIVKTEGKRCLHMDFSGSGKID